MRNLKKILALVLALMMTLSLMVTANASDFKDDSSISEEYAEAVDVLEGMGIYQGDGDNQFLPNDTLKRKDAAALIYRVISGDVEGKYLNNYNGYAAEKFSDVSASAWYEPYVAYATNGNYIQGDGKGHFNPDADITGTEVLTILLRAVGYDQNGEFSENWPLNVATLAKTLGVTDTVASVNLTKAVTREVVAELIFQTITKAYTVKYTPALSYQPVYRPVTDSEGQKTYEYITLGYKVFGLESFSNGQDDWGRPVYGWVYNTGDEITVFSYAKVASYTTKVDECDIAKDLGLKKAAKIESAYIDGEEYKTTDKAVTTNRYATINPTATTSYVGAQGRLTEIYAVKGGYRIVEINTYLAKVTNVTAATTDKNGHETPGYSTLAVYTNADAAKNAGATKTNVGVIDVANPTTNSNKTVYTTSTSFAKDSYVLVTANAATMEDDLVATIEQAIPVASGELTKHTSTTSTVGGVTYDHADKYTLNNPGSLSTVYDVYTDANGNVIGLVVSAKNYLVVEAIAWQYDRIYNGYALADVVLADGKRVENVTVSTVNGETASATGTSGNTYTQGVVNSGTVSAFYTNNDDYYNHIFTYSVNADGTYSIAKGNHVYDQTSNPTPNPVDLTSNNYDIVIKGGNTTIASKTNHVVANDNTVFLVKDAKTGTYTTYVGKNNVPTLNAKKLCALTVGGYATLVVVSDYEAASDTFVAYVPNLTSDAGLTKTVNGTRVHGYTVYNLGSDEANIIWYTSRNLDSSWVSNNGVNYTGLYQITVKDGVVTNMKRLIADGTTTNWRNETDDTYTYARVVTNTITGDYSGNVVHVDNKDLYLDDVIATLAIDQTTGTVSVTSKETIEKNETLLIAYKTVDGYIHPAYVYVVRNSTDDVNTPIGSAVNKLKSVTVDDANVVIAGAYNTLAEALNNAVAITRSSSSAQDYDVKVTTKGVNADGTGIQCYGNMALYGSKEAAKSFTAANDNIFYDGANAITYSNVAPGSYLVINTNNNGVIAYYAYYFA